MPVSTQNSEECLATAIYWESKSEPTEGKAAVGYVIMERTANRHFPKTPCGVVYQRTRLKNGAIGCQFDFACHPPHRMNAAQMAEAHRIARQVLDGTIANPIGEALFFQEAGLRSRPVRRRLYRKVIANQAFFSLTPYDQVHLASR
jgi:spore germination cell wall hydrolase CwlJ-like protein